jgi:hypothetical protein
VWERDTVCVYLVCVCVCVCVCHGVSCLRPGWENLLYANLKTGVRKCHPKLWSTEKTKKWVHRIVYSHHHKKRRRSNSPSFGEDFHFQVVFSFEFELYEDTYLSETSFWTSISVFSILCQHTVEVYFSWLSIRIWDTDVEFDNRTVESHLTLDQNTSWVYLRIPLVKIYSNKEFSQLPKFLRNEQVVPDSFRKFVRKFWKT